MKSLLFILFLGISLWDAVIRACTFSCVDEHRPAFQLTFMYAAFSSSYLFLSVAALASYGARCFSFKAFHRSPRTLPTWPVIGLVSGSY